MYHFAATARKEEHRLRNGAILDLGCGRGGGLAFLNEHFTPKRAVGIDMCKEQIDFAS
jgi:predicted RNA methylase